jgi:2-oxoglutarate dehydrogenase E2 component (dihydrolipoamide succinyltransferase)
MEVKMPQLGESVTEGTVGRWLKQPGDAVKKYEPLLEVVTDKVDTEVPAPETGTLTEILVAEGDTVSVGAVLARLATEAAEPAAAAEATVAATPPAAPAPAEPAAPAERSSPAGRNSYLSPVVSRLVAEHGIDPSEITGSGREGRVTKQDVLRFIEQRKAEPAAEPPPAVHEPVTPAPAPSAPPAAAPPPAPSAANGAAIDIPEDAELLPLSPMRRMIAEHMERSVRTAPHVTAVIEVDLSRIVAHRAANRAAFEQQGQRLTYTPYFVQAVCAGLEAAPVLNGSFSEQGIIVHQRMHIGMAVALDEGLIVPVIRDADEKNLMGLTRSVNDLAERARSRRLKSEETQGGTFTLTNHGVSGSLFATPIINQPQSAILGVGAIVKRPVVISESGVDAIAIKPMCYCSLTFDHRVADGAVGDAFLMAFKGYIEHYH